MLDFMNWFELQWGFKDSNWGLGILDTVLVFGVFVGDAQSGAGRLKLADERCL